MSRDDRLYLRDIGAAADTVATFLEPVDSAEALAADQMRLYAVAYALQIICEAAKNTPQALHEQHPDVAWRDVAQLRNMLVHAYSQISVPTLWQIITSDVPTLRD